MKLLPRFKNGIRQLKEPGRIFFDIKDRAIGERTERYIPLLLKEKLYSAVENEIEGSFKRLREHVKCSNEVLMLARRNLKAWPSSPFPLSI